MNYEKDININPDELDVELTLQPELMYEYSRHAATCRKAFDDASEYLTFIRAKLDNEIRKDPDKYEIPKLTETAITNTILMMGEYQDAAANVNRTRYEMEIARGAVTALEHKKSSLEKLVTLFGAQYFAGPSLPRNLSDMFAQRKEIRQQKADATVIIRRRRT